MVRLRQLYEKACSELKPITNEHVFEAQSLCKSILNASISDVLLDCSLCSYEQELEFLAAIEKRKQGVPIQYIIGEWDFYGLSFFVGEGVLIPRADTEVLVEAVIKHAKGKDGEVNILDLCSGSGCIAIAVDKSVANATVYAIEKSENAFEYLKRNIKRNDSSVTPILADALSYSFLNEIQFDIIVSNPPYLNASDMNDLQKELLFEPSMALFGGGDGLDFYKTLTPHWIKHLKSGGMLGYEIGIGQENEVCEILKQNHLESRFLLSDLCDIVRVVGGIMP